MFHSLNKYLFRNQLLLYNFLLCPAVVLHRPDLIDFDKLKKSNAHYNLQNAFNLAEQHLGLTKLLDPEGKGYRDER